ncbi:cytochrome P450 [Streptomyces hiroshimensis]|uniref:Cytochrome P450 n=1 Tax=Streptomyces hiroshimensis TaxID=66424 RepID=A0ABQ2Y8B6_9ACTN|nr:cytochrome P450 [Streptomyces hiroshimensis]GGX72647.1 cytochrome P450 [Streptomyces hiroshimensis]
MPATYVSGTAPGALPLVGHAWPLMRRPLDFLRSLPAHGDLVEIRLGSVPAYVPCHPGLLRQVLFDDRTFDKGGPFFTRLRDIVGNGLGSCEHRDHRRQRRLVQPSFHRARLEGYAAVMADEAARLSASWHDGLVVDVFPAMFGLTLRTVTRTLFSAHLAEDDVARLQDSFGIALSGLFRRMFVPAPVQRLPLPANRRYERALAGLHDTVDRLVAAYRRGGQDHGDLLSTLIAAREDDGRGGLTDAEVHDQVMTMVFGGSETMAATLTWSLYALARHPEAARDLHAELDAVLGGRAVTPADLPHLPRTGQTVTESLRLYPPAWLFTRVTTAPVEMAGRRLPSGTTMVVSPPVVHHSPAVHLRPGEFRPARWAAEQPGRPPREGFAIFGAGARKCIGDVYAMTEATLALATLCHRWRMDFAPGADTRPPALATVHYPRRLLMRLSERRRAAA